MDAVEIDHMISIRKYIAEFSVNNNVMIITSDSYERTKSFVESNRFPENAKVVLLKEYPGIDIDMLGDYGERSVAIYLDNENEYKGGFKPSIKDIKYVNNTEEHEPKYLEFKLMKLK